MRNSSRGHTNKLIIEFSSLAFAANILAPVLLTFLNLYPYPSFFSDESDTHMDFYNVCHYTLQKLDSYGSWRNIYPPLGHLYCVITSPFFRHLYNSAVGAQFSLRDAAPFYILVAGAMLSILFFGWVCTYKFGYKRGFFLYFCYLAASPQIMVLDRGNLMLFSQIFLNIFFACLMLGKSRFSKAFLWISSGVAAGMKPYMLFPLLLSPFTAVTATFSALVWNIFSYLVWQPPGIELWLQNVTRFTDTAGLIPHFGTLTSDFAIWTSYRYQLTLILKAMDWNSNIVPSNIFVHFALALASIMYICNLMMVLFLLAKAIAVQIRYFGVKGLAYKIPYVDSWLTSKYGRLPQKDSLFLPFCSTYILLFALMPLLTKSIYWYSVILIFPVMMIADGILYNHSGWFTRFFCIYYQSAKVLTLTTLVYSTNFDRACSNIYSLPPATNYLADRIWEWIGIPFAMSSNFIMPQCSLLTAPQIISFMGRTIALPLMASLVTVVLLRAYSYSRSFSLESQT